MVAPRGRGGWSLLFFPLAYGGKGAVNNSFLTEKKQNNLNTKRLPNMFALGSVEYFYIFFYIVLDKEFFFNCGKQCEVAGIQWRPCDVCVCVYSHINPPCYFSEWLPANVYDGWAGRFDSSSALCSAQPPGSLSHLMKKRVDLLQVTDAENRLTQLGCTRPISCTTKAAPRVVGTGERRRTGWSWCSQCIAVIHNMLYVEAAEFQFQLQTRKVKMIIHLWFY